MLPVLLSLPHESELREVMFQLMSFYSDSDITSVLYFNVVLIMQTIPFLVSVFLYAFLGVLKGY